MRCPNCHTMNAAHATTCASCGTALGEADPTTSAAVATHASGPGRERERDILANFGTSMRSIASLPIVLVSALGSLLAVIVSFVLAALAYTAISAIAGIDLPSSASAWWDFGWVAHYSALQVPITPGNATLWTGPLLLLAVPLVSCMAALMFARRAITARDDASSAQLARYGMAAFAAIFTIANLILAAFGPTSTGVQPVMAVLLPIAIACTSYLFVDKLLAMRTMKTVAAGAAPVSEPSTDTTASLRTRTWLRIAAVPAVVLGAMVVVAATITLIANIVQVSTDDGVDARPAVTWDVTRVLDQGWATVNYGWLGRSAVTQGDTTASTHVWNLHSSETASIDAADAGLNMGTLARANLNVASFILVLLAAFGTVILGGIYAGFRTVHSFARTHTRTSAALLGAVVGPVWFAISIVATLAITDRATFSAGALDGGFTSAAGADGCFLALAAGIVLGAIGGLLAAAASSTHAPRTPHHDGGITPTAVAPVLRPDA